jgi:pyruvate-formate lyase-activating enzyme
VSLNCKANDLLRTTLGAERVWAQPGANDAGTAPGAAAEAWHQLTGLPLAPMTTASLGPAFDDDTIQAALDRAGLAWQRVADPATFAAERLAAGEVVCWFQDRLEFGPRALGARSILSDPRNPDHHARVNRMKDREAWRPFGPSVLAGHEGDWFEDAFDARFMLFTQVVRPAQRERVPVVVHGDGSTRPQVVHAETHPRYHRLISAFHERTGVPMVVNTSFNRRGEPIVHKPDDAVEAFEALGADWLVIGGFAVRHGDKVARALPRLADDAALAALPGGRRLMLRATTKCDLDCGHCTLRDHPRLGVDAAIDDLWRSLADGRRAGCDELVVMRGEPLRVPELLDLLRRARRMGYRFLQLQTHGRALADAGLLRGLTSVGVDAVEVMLLGADAPVHDAIAGVDGAFRDTVTGIQAVARAGVDVLVTLPVLRRNAVHLARAVSLVAKLGVRRIQLSFPRPVETKHGVPTRELMRLGPASAAAGRAARHAQKLGLSVSTEGFPLCRLESWLHGTPDATEDFGRHRISDLGMEIDDFTAVRAKIRPDAPPCRSCALARRCPKTWALYLEMFGSAELRPVADGGGASGA